MTLVICWLSNQRLLQDKVLITLLDQSKSSIRKLIFPKLLLNFLSFFLPLSFMHLCSCKSIKMRVYVQMKHLKIQFYEKNIIFLYCKTTPSLTYVYVTCGLILLPVRQSVCSQMRNRYCTQEEKLLQSTSKESMKNRGANTDQYR